MENNTVNVVKLSSATQMKMVIKFLFDEEAMCYSLYLDVTPNIHALMGGAFQRWLVLGCVMLGLRKHD